MSSHYTAIIEIKQVVETPATTDYNKTLAETRTSSDVAHIVVRAETLPELVKKISAHVELL